MDTFTDKLFDIFVLLIITIFATFLLVAIVSSFVDTGLFQVDHTAQTAEVFTKWIELKLK